MLWLVKSTDKSQLYSIVRRKASCFVSLNAPIGCCFLPRQVIPWRSFGFLTQILCIILSLFIIWWTSNDTIRAFEWRMRTHLCVQYKLLPIQHRLLRKVFKKISIFHILYATILIRILIRFIKILWMLQ